MVVDLIKDTICYRSIARQKVALLLSVHGLEIIYVHLEIIFFL